MSIALISERTDHFRDFSVWPRQQDFNVEGWFQNFADSELFVAKKLLASFTYFNKPMTAALMRHSIQKFLSSAWDDHAFPKPPTAADINSVCFVKCEGEDPRATDSGNLFARKLRDDLRVPDSNIMAPAEALQNAADFHHYVFVDDFVGSGNQFIDTLKRVHSAATPYASFQSLLLGDKHTVSYCPCVATSYAQFTRISSIFPKVALYPAHVLIEEHNATLPTSRVWYGMSQDDAKRAIDLLRVISKRAGYSEEDGGQDAWHGFHGLGLTLGFEHGIPDASLPVFFSERNGWRPLMRRAS
ncbi:MULTISPECIES: hypothetical protein [Rhizobium]|uniref:phosphoribosyltransferase-like protein n=1 Tax=Rhizobium TaxID=379 RepID=UPI001C82B01A|nr:MULTISPECIES: hypothetical protein [Rhizobium]MBX4924682.1 hypothetical protein [Rhizobium binae]MBX5213421.1 hypothetical protein [Rhizobium sp. NLR9a]MBX5230937.1 hypothetical protein [Rhizobium sp. NLR4a]MBX5243687.1 hypothetical protein [Rhizobium sp. NLR3b]MBX5267323.1 hypothetical protein [Rhizobium sp. NLR17b]